MSKESKNNTKSFLIKDINVLTMIDDIILKNQDIFISEGLVQLIGPTDSLDIEDYEYKIINGTNKFVMPGLADMHVHLWKEGDFILNLANGVTTIRNLWGSPKHLAWRNKYQDNPSIFIPNIITTTPLIDGEPPIWARSKIINNPEEVDAYIDEIINRGYDQIKVYNLLRKEVYHKILEISKERNIKVTGHIPYSINLIEAIESGQYCIEHMDSYNYYSTRELENIPKTSKENYYLRLKYLVDNYDEDLDHQLISKTIENETWNCVTHIVRQRLGRASKISEFMNQQGIEFVDPEKLASWDPKQDFRTQEMGHEEEKYYDILSKRDIKRTGKLYKAGGKILLGTDTANPFVIPGFAIHQELENLISAGLTNFEVLLTGTRVASEFMESDEFGIIEVGRRADLIITENNPLYDLSTIRNPNFVFLRGYLYPRALLEEKLNKFKKSFSEEIYFLKFPIHDNFKLFQSEYNTYKLNQIRLITNKDNFRIDFVDKPGNFYSSIIKSVDKVEIEYNDHSLKASINMTKNGKTWRIEVNEFDDYEFIHEFNESKEIYPDGLTYYLLNYRNYLTMSENEEIDINYYSVSIFHHFVILKNEVKITRKANSIQFETSNKRGRTIYEVKTKENEIIEFSHGSQFGKTTYFLLSDE